MDVEPSENSPDCPLITPYTTKVGIAEDTLQRLYKVRSWDIESGEPIPFKWPTRLRTILPSGADFRLREYQKQGVHSLSRMMRFVLGDSVGLGKTIQGISASCWLMDRLPRMKVIVLATKSTTHQWVSEFETFSTLRAHVMEEKFGKEKGHAARVTQLKNFLANDDHDVLVCKYSSLVGRRKKIEGKFDDEGRPVRGGKEAIASEVKEFREILRPYKQDIILITDEAQKYKSVASNTRVMIQVLQSVSGRVWAMTATALKNSLDEFYAIALAIGIAPFGSMQEFYGKFCIFREMPVGKGRIVNKLVGYRNVAEFKAGMRPFFLGRSQKQVKEPLPKLQTIIHSVDLDDDQRKLLLEDIPNGDFILPPALVKVRGDLMEKERDPDNMMTMMSVMQLVANHSALLDPGNKKVFFTKSLSPKEEMLLDLLDGDLKGEHVICYSKFRMHIDRLEHLTKEGHFTERKFLRITGAENETRREENKKLFQDPNGDHDLIMINSAACEGINLQQAAHMIVLDLPWSFGDFLQLVGRMVRMASPHSACTLHILVAKGTLDEFALETLKGKKKLFSKILGSSHTSGLLDDNDIEDLKSGMEQVASDSEFRSLLQAHVKSVAMKGFIDGTQLDAAAMEGEGYKMVFEKGAKKRKTSQKVSDGEEFEELMKLWK